MKFMNFAKKYGQKIAVGASLASFSALSLADGIELPIDAATVTAAIVKVGTIISSIGMAFISLYVTMMCFNLVKGWVKNGR